MDQQKALEKPKSRRSRRRANTRRRSASTSPAPSKRVSDDMAFTVAKAFGTEDCEVSAEASPVSQFPPDAVVTVDLGSGFDQGYEEGAGEMSPRRRAKSDVFRSTGSSGSISSSVNRPRSGTDGSSGSLGASICLSPRKDGNSSVEGAGLKALLSCLKVLEESGFVRVREEGKSFVCDDVMLIDQVWPSVVSLPFRSMCCFWWVDVEAHYDTIFVLYIF